MPIPDSISAFIDAQAQRAPGSYDDLRVVVFNGTTKRSPETSHTDGLLAIPRRIFAALGVRCDEVRTVDRTIPPGLWPDMREYGYADDDFPEIYRSLVVPADILMLAGPIWLGDQSSQTRIVIERLYAYSGEVNEHGQRTAGSTSVLKSCTRFNTSASRSLRSRTATGPGRPDRVRLTSTRTVAGSETRGRPATRRS
jgi:hypothetical protein